MRDVKSPYVSVAQQLVKFTFHIPRICEVENPARFSFEVRTSVLSASKRAAKKLASIFGLRK